MKMCAIKGKLFIIKLIVLVNLMRIITADNLALLSATLRTYQRAGCDTEQVALSCPRGTSISIEVAQYGKTGDDSIADNICPPTTDDTIINGIQSSIGTEIEIKSPESCLWPNALQYSLLQTVVEACQKKRHCKFLASPRTFGGDPCPGVRKFVEVAYKCRPYEFRSKVACENDVIQLICNPYSRIAIYSASYGRTEYESIQCSQPQGVKEETCLVSYATETVMQICHGKRRCTLSADSNTFGKPCRPDSRMYLKVVYTCVPRKVLKDRYDSLPEVDEPQQSALDQDQDDLYDEDQFYRESEAIPPSPKLQGALNKEQNPSNKSTPITTVHHPTSIVPFLKTSDDTNLQENQERFYLYLILSVTAAIILCLILIIGRLLIQRHRVRRNNKVKKEFQTSNTGETTLPNGFGDDISEIDGDIDLTTSLPLPSVSRNDPNYGIYTPSQSPYGNIGPSNISHTSSTMLVPSHSIIGGQPPAIIGAPNTLMGPVMMPGSMSTLPHHGYLNGSLLPPSHHGTLRRQQQQSSQLLQTMDRDATMPRSLSRGGGGDNSKYYYG